MRKFIGILPVLAMLATLFATTPAQAEVDLRNIKPTFTFIGNHVYGLDFSSLVTSSTWLGEIKGNHSHVINDTAAGWVFSALGITVNDILVNASSPYDMSDFACGSIVPVDANAAAVEVDLDATSIAAAGCEVTFIFIKDAAAGFTLDVGAYMHQGTVDQVFYLNDGVSFKMSTVSDGTNIKWATDRPIDFEKMDSEAISLGNAADFSCEHNATDTICTSGTGDFVLDNTDVDDPTVFRLGTDTNATSVEVHNNTDVAIFRVFGDGVSAFLKDVAVTFGAGLDFSILHNGTNTLLTNSTGTLALGQNDSAADVAGRALSVYGGAGGNGVGAAAGAGGSASLSAGAGGDEGAGGAAANGATISITGGGGGDALAVTSTAAGGTGGTARATGGVGGAAGDGHVGGNGGTILVNGGAGGAGSAAQVGGVGGAVSLNAGAGGVTGGAGAGANGALSICGTTGVSIGLGNATDNTTITQTGSGQVIFSGNVNATAGLDVTTAALTAAAGLTVSAGAVSITDSVGDLLLDATTAGAEIVAQLGSDATGTKFEVRTNTGTAILAVDPIDATSGLTTVTGNFTYTGHKDNQNLLSYHFSIDAPGATEFVWATGRSPFLDGGGGALANKVAYNHANGLKVGDEVVSFTVFGTAAEATTTVLDATMYEIDANGTENAMPGGACSLDTTVTVAGDFSSIGTCAGLTTVSANHKYSVKFDGSVAAAGDTILITGVTYNLNRK